MRPFSSVARCELLAKEFRSRSRELSEAELGWFTRLEPTGVIRNYLIAADALEAAAREMERLGEGPR